MLVDEPLRYTPLDVSPRENQISVLDTVEHAKSGLPQSQDVSI